MPPSQIFFSFKLRLELKLVAAAAKIWHDKKFDALRKVDTLRKVDALEKLTKFFRIEKLTSLKIWPSPLSL